MRFLPRRRDPAQAANTMLPAGTTDQQVITLWLKQSESEQTQAAYLGDLRHFFGLFPQKPLREITLADLQEFKDSLEAQGLKRATIARRISAIKSLLSFCATTKYLPLNVGAAIKPPKVENKLAERIMSEAQMQRILAREENERNHALLRLLYNSGMRVSEVCALTWRDLQPRPDLPSEQGELAQVRAYGKGGKERYVLISAETYAELQELRAEAPDGQPIFLSRNGGQLSRCQVLRIVEVAAIRAGIATYEDMGNDGQPRTRSRVSPHWFRHAHASHALEKGASPPLVRDTLGHRNIATLDKYAHARPDVSSGKYLAV